MPYINLPGVPVEKQDGGLAILPSSAAPRVLVIGTASSGTAETPYLVGRAQEAAVEFGADGTLIRGMYEVKAAGAENVILFRIGATPAILEGIGVDAATGGVTIETRNKDSDMGDSYSFYWDNTTHVLSVRNVDNDEEVYRRDFDDALPTVDLGEVFVTGTYTNAEGEDIGSEGSELTFTAAAASTSPDYDLTLTAGTDGTELSRMELYEQLFKAYKLLENEDFDFIVPMNVYVDDANVADGDTFVASPGTTYPTVSSDDDILLYFYAEEFEGEWYFYWRQTKTSGAADIYPTGYQSTTPNGETVTSTLFHEVNFGYQLADFCYNMSADQNECHGFIGVKAPASTGLRDVNVWLGLAPTYTVQGDGTYKIESADDDGTGLMGIKFMAGKYGFRSGEAYGGFIATEEGFVDGTEEEDRGGEKIDIGQYISVCGQWLNVYNAFDTTGLGYITNLATTYAGMVSALDPKSAPTNKVIPTGTLPFRVSNSKLDSLVGMRYIFCQTKPKGTVIADAPTAALPGSDYRRLTTVRIVKAVVDAVRQVADPFIGEAGGTPQRAALETALQAALQKLAKAGYLSRFEMAITATPAERANGEATVELVLVPAFELRRITVVISLRAV